MDDILKRTELLGFRTTAGTNALTIRMGGPKLTTLVVPKSFVLTVDEYQNMVLEEEDK